MDKPKLLTARVILEMLGAPEEHIKKTMESYIEQLKKDREVLKADIAETKKQDVMFSIFTELEMKFIDLDDLFGFCFEAMPSSVEVIDPEHLKFDAAELNRILNDLQGKLHDADMIVKTLQAKQQILDLNATNVFRRFLICLCEKGVTTASEMSHYVGVHPKELTKFLDKLVTEERLIKEGEEYKTKDGAQKSD